MANSFFQPGERRAAKVQELFAAIAPRYDLINDLQSFGLHRYWKSRAVRLARPRPGEKVLDVCCGTGDLARALARCQAEVIGLDFSMPMLEFAHAKREPLHASACSPAEARPERTTETTRGQLQFVCGDAQELPFRDNTFEIVTIGYGLRNLAHWETGLQEMARVAKPGGRLVVLDFGKPEGPLWRSAYFAYLRMLVPCLGRVFCGNASAYAYILESLKHYPAQRGVASKMRELGLTGIQMLEFLGGAMSINYGVKPPENLASPNSV